MTCDSWIEIYVNGHPLVVRCELEHSGDDHEGGGLTWTEGIEQ